MRRPGCPRPVLRVNRRNVELHSGGRRHDADSGAGRRLGQARIQHPQRNLRDSNQRPRLRRPAVNPSRIRRGELPGHTLGRRHGRGHEHDVVHALGLRHQQGRDPGIAAHHFGAGARARGASSHREHQRSIPRGQPHSNGGALVSERCPGDFPVGRARGLSGGVPERRVRANERHERCADVRRLHHQHGEQRSASDPDGSAGLLELQSIHLSGHSPRPRSRPPRTRPQSPLSARSPGVSDRPRTGGRTCRTRRDTRPSFTT